MNATHRPALRLALMASLLAMTQAAPAITFHELDASGNAVRTYVPQLADWVLAPDAEESAVTALAGGGFAVDMGLSNWGTSETAFQARQISGAGVLLPGSAHGYRIDFSANLRTWDSYNDGSVLPLEGGQIGLWDLFSVNANTQGFYWNLVSAAAGPDLEAGPQLTDPLLPAVPAGSVVRYTNTGNASALPGATWAWGGRDYAAGLFESVQVNSSVTLAAGGPVFVSLVLDSRTPVDTDSDYPSWGQFSAVDRFGTVPDGELGQGPGSTPTNPLLPVDGNPSDGVFLFQPFFVGTGGVGTETFLFIDPVVAIGFDYQVTGDPLVTSLQLPSLGDANGYDVELLVGTVWTVVGHVDDGGTFSFASGVSGFRITDIDPALGLDPNNPVVFVTGLKFDREGTVSITMSALTAPIPEPGAAALMLVGLAALALRRRRLH